MEAFCKIMRDSSEGPMLAAQTLAARIHTPNSREALLGLMMLDRVMRRGDTNFHAEVGKFRFLNEMIKLVSPKYFADRTAVEVRTRVSYLCFLYRQNVRNYYLYVLLFFMLMMLTFLICFILIYSLHS